MNLNPKIDDEYIERATAAYNEWQGAISTKQKTIDDAVASVVDIDADTSGLSEKASFDAANASFQSA